MLSPDAARELLGHQNGTIHLRNDSTYEAAELHVLGDSLTFADSSTHHSTTLGLRDIASVTRFGHTAGAGQGVVFTFAALCLEYEAGSLFLKKHRSGAEWAGSYVLGGTLIAGAIGTIYGAIHGRDEIYSFNSDSLVAHALGPVGPEIIVPPDPLDVKVVLRAGLECGAYAVSQSDSYTIEPGFTAGFMTGIQMYRASYGAYQLGIDLGYTRVMGYDRLTTFNWNGRYLYKNDYDLRRQLAFVELGLHPQLLFPLGNGFIGCVYGGGSVGVGSADIMYTRVWSTVVDSSKYSFWPFDEGEENGPFMTTGSYEAGIGVFYKRLMLDLRYKYVSIRHDLEYHNVYVQLGFVLW